jgi:hypothetical protein
MYVFLQEGRIIIFNEWLCISFVGKHDSLGHMSSSFLGLLGANQPKFMVPWGKWPQILKSNMFSQMGPKHGSPRQPKFPRENMVLWSK